MRIKKNNNKGFTLIELLIGIVIVVILSTAVVVLISSSFRISNKTTNEGIVRENGNNALNVIQKTIQFAYGFYGVSNDPTFATFTSDCTVDSDYSYVRVKSSTGVTQQFSCTADGHLYFDNGAGNADLIDTSKLSIPSCQFYCSQSSISTPPVIGIKFTLSLKSSTNLPEQNSTIDFETSAKMRNL